MKTATEIRVPWSWAKEHPRSSENPAAPEPLHTCQLSSNITPVNLPPLKENGMGSQPPTKQAPNEGKMCGSASPPRIILAPPCLCVVGSKAPTLSAHCPFQDRWPLLSPLATDPLRTHLALTGGSLTEIYTSECLLFIALSHCDSEQHEKISHRIPLFIHT